MKARVYVSMKPTVLDPQGQTIRSALAGLGHTSIAAVRQGKFFEITLEPGTSTVDSVSRFAGKTNMEKPPRMTIFCCKIGGL